MWPQTSTVINMDSNVTTSILMDRVGSQIETRDMIQYVTQDNIGITVQPFQDSYKWKEKKQQNTEFKCLN